MCCRNSRAGHHFNDAFRLRASRNRRHSAETHCPGLFAKVQYLYLHILQLNKTIGVHSPGGAGMEKVRITRDDFLEDRQGKTFADVINDPEQLFDKVLEFFNDADRQRRMEESELHHDRSPLAGVVRELESQIPIDQLLAGVHARRNARWRQAIGVLVRIIMERRGWQKTGRKGSLGVRAAGTARTPAHNTGGLAFWFVRAERYERVDGMPYRSVRERCQELTSAPSRPTRNKKRLGRRSAER